MPSQASRTPDDLYMLVTRHQSNNWARSLGPNAFTLYVSMFNNASHAAGFTYGILDASYEDMCESLGWETKRLRAAVQDLYRFGLVDVWRAPSRWGGVRYIYVVYAAPIYAEGTTADLQADFRVWPRDPRDLPFAPSSSRVRPQGRLVSEMDTPAAAVSVSKKPTPLIPSGDRKQESLNLRRTSRQEIPLTEPSAVPVPLPSCPPEARTAGSCPTPARVAAFGAQHAAGLRALAAWRFSTSAPSQEQCDAIAQVLLVHADLDMSYAPAVARRLTAWQAPARLRNPDGALVTFLRNEPLRKQGGLPWRPSQADLRLIDSAEDKTAAQILTALQRDHNGHVPAARGMDLIRERRPDLFEDIPAAPVSAQPGADAGDSAVQKIYAMWQQARATGHSGVVAAWMLRQALLSLTHSEDATSAWLAEHGVPTEPLGA